MAPFLRIDEWEGRTGRCILSVFQKKADVVIKILLL